MFQGEPGFTGLPGNLGPIGPPGTHGQKGQKGEPSDGRAGLKGEKVCLNTFYIFVVPRLKSWQQVRQFSGSSFCPLIMKFQKCCAVRN